MKRSTKILIALLVAFNGVAIATVTYRSAIPMGTAASWSAATGADPSAVQGPWIDNTTATNLRYQTGGSAGTANYVPFCVPTVTGQTCTWDSVTGTWAVGTGGGTQGGTTTASHIPYASAGNTLSDSSLSYNSGSNTVSGNATTSFDLSASSGTFKAPGGGSNMPIPVVFQDGTLTMVTMSKAGSTAQLLPAAGYNFRLTDSNGNFSTLVTTTSASMTAPGGASFTLNSGIAFTTGLWGRGVQLVADTNATVTTSSVIEYTSITAARTVTLPLANALGAGVSVIVEVLDASGSATSTNKIQVLRAGADTVNGSAVAVDAVVAAYNGRTLYSDGVSKWTMP